jgi:hypothetical protein
MPNELRSEAWTGLLDADPRPWLLESDEPAARWLTLTHLLDLPASDPEVVAAHAAVVSDAGTRGVIARLRAWGVDTGVSGHNSPGYAPNLLHLLADMGVGPGDDECVEALLDKMLEHQDAEGRFLFYARGGHGSQGRPREPAWGSLTCDRHAIVEVLVRFGRGDDPRVKAAVARMAAELAETAQGRSWLCLPDRATGFRGPGRKADFCPQVALEALRTFARLPASSRPPGLLDTARVSLRAWTRKHEQRPYMFGHGRRFLTAKWPGFWYDAHWFLDTLGRYPELWRGEGARGEGGWTLEEGGRVLEEDSRALAEVTAGLVTHNFGPGGRVTPRSCYQGFAGFSFGQKKVPSPFATARLAVVLRRFDEGVAANGQTTPQSR